MSSNKVWFVTGASQGLGLILVKKLLSKGHRVAATSRTASTLKQAVGIHSENFLPLAVDLHNVDSIEHAVQQTLHTFGRIDVVVNNAGYGMSGTLEEIDDVAIQSIFTVNVLATIHVTKTILPYLRKQRSGYIINLSSVAGFSGAPGWSIYSATKAAVTAFSEVLAADVKEFGIYVTAVQPSGFRTGFLSQQSLAVKDVQIEGYQAVKDTQSKYLAMNDKQQGDPDKAAEIMIDLSETVPPPLHLFLGKDAYTRANIKIEQLAKEVNDWKAVTTSADFQDS
ncbi:MAG TPA: SDR family NAD(P)-dependent oxidoreductase [Ohtaekwangia sp.]|uniref:SDR family NAD(P)-dependent oxidoreductase n=1 Tax=Ohtaekwangia sp. TaxID=2066019 RepID=UPI002F93AF43